MSTLHLDARAAAPGTLTAARLKVTKSALTRSRSCCRAASSKAAISRPY
jgi:hypothetical protein